jgi:hypothetical protein
MTKPLVDSGAFRRVAEFAAPWPAFVYCIADRVEQQRQAALMQVLALVLDEASRLRAQPDAATMIARRYGLTAPDVAEWLVSTRWCTRVGVAPSDLSTACAALASLGVLARNVDATDCLASGGE